MSFVVLTPVLESGPRLTMRISEADANQVTRGPGLKGVVTDLDTGERYEVHGAPCSQSGPHGSGCWCDAVAVLL